MFSSQIKISPTPSTRPVPLYQQVKDYIVDRIESGRWYLETKIPSENELVQRLGVSRMTINRALRELTSAGRLVRLQGVGTFVAAPKTVSTLLEIKPIAEEISQKGQTHSCQVKLKRAESAPSEIATVMSLDSGVEIFHITLVHFSDGLPIQLEDRWVNPKVAPDFLNQDFTTITPSRYLLDCVPLNEAEHVIESIMPDKQIRNFLDIGPDEPCLVLYRRTWTGDTVATRSQLVHPGSRFRIGGRFKPTTPGQPVEA